MLNKLSLDNKFINQI